MKPRITVVLEYENDADVPRIGVDTKDFGNFKVAAIQFADALLEIDVLHEYCRPVDIHAANDDPRMIEMFRRVTGSAQGAP